MIIKEEVIATPEQRRLAEYLRKCRGVSEVNPQGDISQRDLAKRMNINNANIQNYEALHADPDRIDGDTIRKMAFFPASFKNGKAWSEAEFRAYLRGEDYHPKEFDAILASIRWCKDFRQLLDIQHEVVRRMEELVGEGSASDLMKKNGAFPKFNRKILELLAKRQQFFGMTDDEYGSYCAAMKLTDSEVENIKLGGEISVPVLGFVARVLGVSVDQLADLKSEKPSEISKILEGENS